MKRVFLISLAVVLAISIGVVGCETTEPTAPVDTLVIAQSSLVEETMLPWNGGARRKYYLSGTIYESLTRKTRMGQELPLLATNWEMSLDGMTWTVTIQEGVQFHDGWGELTSADVKYTFERLMGEDAVMHITAGLQGDIESIETPGPYTVVFNLNTPNAMFMNLYGSADMIGVVCKEYVETVGDDVANANPIGTGPYTLAEYVAGAHIMLTTVEDVAAHWRLTPDFKNIKFVLMPDMSARTMGLMSGDVHFAEIGLEVVPYVEASVGLTVVRQTEKASIDLIRFMGLNLLDPPEGENYPRFDLTNPWADNTTVGDYTAGQLVRQAMNLAINKQEIADTLYHGMASPAAAPNDVFEWLALDPYPYNPAEAISLLELAGYPDGFSLTIADDGRFSNSLLAAIAADAWEAIGLDVTIESWTWLDMRAAWGSGALKHGYVLMHRSPATGTDPLLSINMAFNPANFLACYTDETTEAIRTAIAAELDLEVRSDLWTQFGEYVNEQATQVFLVNMYPPIGVTELLDEPRDSIDLFDNVEYIKLK